MDDYSGIKVSPYVASKKVKKMIKQIDTLFDLEVFCSHMKRLIPSAASEDILTLSFDNDNAKAKECSVDLLSIILN